MTYPPRMCPNTRIILSCHYVIFIVLLVWSQQQIECRTPRKQLLANLINKALGLGRMSKWNEFMEEQPSRTSATLSVKSSNESSSTSNSKTQSLIDETKDPNSPFYISMISSNIGGSHASNTLLNIRNTNINNNISSNNITNTQSSSNSPLLQSSTPTISSQTPSSPGSLNKLFTYAFPSTHPPRGQLKRPLITYINVSNLEEHETVDV